MFWTQRVPERAVSANSEAGKGRYRQFDLDIRDYYNIPNALAGGPSEPAVVSFDMRWNATEDLVPMRSDEQGYEGEFAAADATIAWEADGAQFSFRSDDVTENVFSFIGRERNGRFLT